MSLTPPFGQNDLLCPSCPLWVLCAADEWDDYQETGTLPDLARLLLAQHDELMACSGQVGLDVCDTTTYQDVIDDESKAAWREYEDERYHTAASDALDHPVTTSALQALDERLRSITWLRSNSGGRRHNTKKFTRRGGRYRLAQNHGTSSQIRGIVQSHERWSNLHANGVIPEIARRQKVEFLARRADMAWWDHEDDPETYDDEFTGLRELLDGLEMGLAIGLIDMHDLLDPGLDDMLVPAGGLSSDPFGEEDLFSPHGLFDDPFGGSGYFD